MRITPDIARQLKQQPDIPQGRRDALLMTLLLDHGLRVSEVDRLQVSDIDMEACERGIADGWRESISVISTSSLMITRRVPGFRWQLPYPSVHGTRTELLRAKLARSGMAEGWNRVQGYGLG